jgi:hypothetical protein
VAAFPARSGRRHCGKVLRAPLRGSRTFSAECIQRRSQFMVIPPISLGDFYAALPSSSASPTSNLLPTR